MSWNVVTPCVGVWIEIPDLVSEFKSVLSLPAWECGLKSQILIQTLRIVRVTPCVGVWIEILLGNR